MAPIDESVFTECVRGCDPSILFAYFKQHIALKEKLSNKITWPLGLVPLIRLFFPFHF